MNAQDKKYAIWTMAESDPEYRVMLRNIRDLEQVYEAVLEKMDNESKRVICEYVALCEEMSERMLDIACERMDFCQV